MRTWSGVLVLVLGGVSTTCGADVADLVSQMSSKSADQRRLAARELGTAQGPVRDIVAALVRGLEDPDFFVRRFSAQSLGQRGKDASAAVPALVRLTRSKSERREVVEAAIVALGGMGSSAVAPLADVVKDSEMSADLRRRAAQGLARLGPGARAAVPALTEALSAPPRRRGQIDQDIRVDVVTALGEIASSKDEATLKALEDLAMQRLRDRTLASALRQAVRKIKARK